MSINGSAVNHVTVLPSLSLVLVALNVIYQTEILQGSIPRRGSELCMIAIHNKIFPEEYTSGFAFYSSSKQLLNSATLRPVRINNACRR